MTDHQHEPRILDLRQFYGRPSMEVDPLLPEHAALRAVRHVLDHIEDVSRHHATRTGTDPLYEVPYCNECGYVYDGDTANSHTSDFLDALHLIGVLEQATPGGPVTDQSETSNGTDWPYPETDRTHVPAPPATIGGATGLVYCKACGFLLWSGSGPSKGPRASRPCAPVLVRFRGAADKVLLPDDVDD